MKTKRIILTLLIVGMGLNYTITFGQISQGGIPYSFKSRLKSTTDKDTIALSKKIPSIEMPKLKKSQIDSIKEKNAKGDEAFQFAYSFETDIDVKTSSVIDSLPTGLLYRLSVKSPQALSLNLIFKRYVLPIGAKLFLYSKDKQDLKGAFSSNNNKGSGRLPTMPIKGDEIVIEYFEPYFTSFQGELNIGVVSHDFVGITEVDIDDDFGSSGPCQVDINCPEEGDDWQIEKKAVVRIVANGNTHCSGTLINNTSNNGTPYILTAFHCVDRFQGWFGSQGSDGKLSKKDKKRVSDFIFIFNYESPTCRGGDGSVAKATSSSTFRSAFWDSDFALLEMSKRPYASYRPFYAGWDRNNTQGTGGVGIHHPAGDVKKISTFNMAPINSDCIGGGRPQNDYYLINNWIQTANGHGVTEGGSSGSPLFNDNGLVIGQLFGGCPDHNDNCANPANDFSNYGKIFSSWNSGSGSDERLRNWLDPRNTGATTWDGLEGCPPNTSVNINITHTITSGSVEIYRATNTITASGAIESGATVTYEAGQSITLLPGFHAEAGSDFIARIRDFGNCIVLCDPINLTAWTSFVCSGDNLCFNVTNANNYSISVYNSAGGLVYQNTGAVGNNSICVWNTAGVAVGIYTATVSFTNPCEELSNSYQLSVTSCKKSAKTNNSDNVNQNSFVIEKPNTQNKNSSLKVNVFPNPNEGMFSLEISNSKPYSLEILNTTGAVLYEINHLNVPRVNLNQTGLNPGVYYIRVIHGNDTVIKKIAIQ